MKKNLKLWYKVFVSWEWLETVFLRKFLVSLECKNSNYLCCLLPKEREKLLVSDITLAIRNELPASLVFPQSGTTTTSPMQFTQTLMNKTGLGFCPESSIFGFLRNWTKNFPPKYLCWQTNFWRAKFSALSAHCQLTCVKSQKSKRDIKSDLFISTRILIFIGLYLYLIPGSYRWKLKKKGDEKIGFTPATEASEIKRRSFWEYKPTDEVVLWLMRERSFESKEIGLL